MRNVKFFTVLTAALALMTGMTSCNNDDAVVNNEIEKGLPTTMGITISTGLQTKVVGDVNATDYEVTMNTVNVLIYNEVGDDFTLEQNVSLKSTDFTDGETASSSYEATNKIKTTTGIKKIYVAMNYPGTLPAIGSTISSLENLIYTLKTATALSTNGLAMFSVEAISAELVTEGDSKYDINNTKTITVKRMVAKVTVQEEIERDGDDNIISEGGVLSNIEFAIGHANKSIYPIQKVGATEEDEDIFVVKDPNWSSSNLGDFFNIDENKKDGDDSEYIAVDNKDAEALTAVYAPENTAKAYEVDGSNLTYISVRAQYVPAFFCDEEGISKGEEYVSDSDGSFWTVYAKDGSIKYFDDVDDAKAYATFIEVSEDEVSAEYVNGICYFRAYINKKGVADKDIEDSVAAKFDVLRNNYYKANITSIKAPGKPTDENILVTEDTSLVFSVTILDWVTVEQDDYEL